MLKNIGLIIVCNLLMYLILLLIWKFGNVNIAGAISGLKLMKKYTMPIKS